MVKQKIAKFGEIIRGKGDERWAVQKGRGKYGVLCCTVLYCVVLCCIVVCDAWCVWQSCSLLQPPAASCSLLQPLTASYSLLQPLAAMTLTPSISS